MPDNMYPYRNNWIPSEPPKEKVKMNKHKKAAIGYGSILAIIAIASIVSFFTFVPLHAIREIGIEVCVALAGCSGITGIILLVEAFSKNYRRYKASKDPHAF